MKNKGIWVLISVLLGLGLLIGSFGCAAPAPAPTPTPTSKPPAEVYTMKVSGAGVPGYPHREFIEKFMGMVEERAEGRVEFEYFPTFSLYGSKTGGEATTAGLVQIAHVSIGYLSDQVGAPAKAYIAPLTYSRLNYNANYRKGFLPWMQEAVTKANVNWKILAYAQHGYSRLVSRVPIRGPEDLKGKLIRGTSGQAPALDLLGASPVTMGVGDIFEALQRGTIDAATGSISLITSYKFTDAAEYVINVDLYPGCYGTIMPLDYYNSLPDDLRKIIDESIVEAEKGMEDWVIADEEKALSVWRADPKIEVIEWTEAQVAELSKVMGPYHSDMKDKFGEEWVKFLDIVEKDNLGP